MLELELDRPFRSFLLAASSFVASSAAFGGSCSGHSDCCLPCWPASVASVAFGASFEGSSGPCSYLPSRWPSSAAASSRSIAACAASIVPSSVDSYHSCPRCLELGSGVEVLDCHRIGLLVHQICHDHVRLEKSLPLLQSCLVAVRA